MLHRCRVAILAAGCFFSAVANVCAADMPWIRVSPDKRGFVQSPGERPFAPWGFNYDHDRDGRLIEDYWNGEWNLVETHFQQMRDLRANVVRIHLQLGKFMAGPDKLDTSALERLSRLVSLAETHKLYLDLTGLACYHKKDVPAWYDELSETERWNVQSRFWKAIAAQCAGSPAIFCYDLMNEPVVPGGQRTAKDWLGPAFAGKHFVQFITLDQADRPRPEIARAWIAKMAAAIREVDQRHLITVGLVDWSLDRPGLTSGFVPEKTTAELDFVCVHLYPEKGKLKAALETLRAFAAVGKPVVIEETFPLKCSMEEMEQFLDEARPHTAGWISFYWGKPPAELRQSTSFGDALLLKWLEIFQQRAP